MRGTKADIIAELQKQILPLQGYKAVNRNTIHTGLGPIENAFPNQTFPLGAIHEFIAANMEDASATNGFMAGVLASLMHDGGASLWISASRTIFPPALISFGIAPDKIIFIDLKREKDVLWAMEEALKCNSVTAVIGEMRELDFTASRRLQLAVEQSRVTGFILRKSPRQVNTTACITRWKITHLSSRSEDEMPGVGFPRWNVELIKVRNGKPGSWQIEWRTGSFRHVSKLTVIIEEQQKKTG